MCATCLVKYLVPFVMNNIEHKTVIAEDKSQNSKVKNQKSKDISDIKYKIQKSQIVEFCRGNESLFVKSGSHDQDGRHAHIW